MDDTLEFDYARVLRHISAVVSDGKRPEFYVRIRIYVRGSFIDDSSNPSVFSLADRLRSEMIDGVPIRKLFVGNLAERVRLLSSRSAFRPIAISDEFLFQTTFKDLRDRFSTYGNVESCYLRRNQGRNNYAFVTFARVADAVT